MTVHRENLTVQEVLILQLEGLYREAFIMAERLVLESATRVGVSKEEAFAHIPNFASELRNQFSGLGQVSGQMHGVQLDKVIEDVDRVLNEVKKRNKDLAK